MALGVIWLFHLTATVGVSARTENDGMAVRLPDLGTRLGQHTSEGTGLLALSSSSLAQLNACFLGLGAVARLFLRSGLAGGVCHDRVDCFCLSGLRQIQNPSTAVFRM